MIIRASSYRDCVLWFSEINKTPLQALLNRLQFATATENHKLFGQKWWHATETLTTVYLTQAESRNTQYANGWITPLSLRYFLKADAEQEYMNL